MTDRFNNEDALETLAKQCDESVEKIAKCNGDLQQAVPIHNCGAHWHMVRSLVAGNDGTKTLLHCRAEEYRERIRIQEGETERRKGIVAVKKPWWLPASTTAWWILAIIVVALASSGALPALVKWLASVI